MHYNNHSGAQTVCDALNKEDMTMYEDTSPARHLQTKFWIFKRSSAVPGLGYMPQASGESTLLYEATRQGAERALQDHLYFIRNQNHKAGHYLVQSPQGAWTFEVKPPAPAPLVIEAV